MSLRGSRKGRRGSLGSIDGRSVGLRMAQSDRFGAEWGHMVWMGELFSGRAWSRAQGLMTYSAAIREDAE